MPNWQILLVFLRFLFHYLGMELKEYRKSRKLTQKEAAGLIGIPYRTYVRYEEEESYRKKFLYRKVLEDLIEKCRVDEDHGVLSLSLIKEELLPILEKYEIRSCYLFGSYARNEAKENSDIDLLVDTDISGMQFFELVEEIRSRLGKRIDLLRLKDLEPNNPLPAVILKEGIKIR